MTGQCKILLAKTEDLFRLCEKYSSARFSPFLDGSETAGIQDNMRFPYGYNTMFYGGFKDAERKILGVFPEWEDADENLFPVSAVKFTSSFSKQLSHRDYLGTVMSLGIERGKIGDILIDGNTAYVFAYNDIADYIAHNIKKVANTGVKTEVISPADVIIPEKEYKISDIICASMRLDAVISGAVNISRNKAAELIRSGAVKLNHREEMRTAQEVKENDLVSVRGFGRFTVDKAGNKTRSGKLHITIKISV